MKKHVRHLGKKKLSHDYELENKIELLERRQLMHKLILVICMHFADKHSAEGQRERNELRRLYRRRRISKYLDSFTYHISE